MGCMQVDGENGEFIRVLIIWEEVRGVGLFDIVKNVLKSKSDGLRSRWWFVQSGFMKFKIIEVEKFRRLSIINGYRERLLGKSGSKVY